MSKEAIACFISSLKPSLISCFSKSLPSLRKTIISLIFLEVLHFSKCFLTHLIASGSASLKINQGICKFSANLKNGK